MSTLGDTLQSCEDISRAIVMGETWGHLAPKRGSRYKLRVVYAVGCFGDDELNPTPLLFESRKLDSSPWFHDCLMEWLCDLPEDERKPGCVYEFNGWFRNYHFDGTINRIVDATQASNSTPLGCYGK